MCFYFTSEFRNYLELSSALFHLVLKLASAEYSNLICQKLAIVVLQTTQNLVFSRRCFAEDGKDMYQELVYTTQNSAFRAR